MGFALGALLLIHPLLTSTFEVMLKLIPSKLPGVSAKSGPAFSGFRQGPTGRTLVPKHPSGDQLTQETGVQNKAAGARDLRINFGSEVERYSRPFMVNLHSCGGSILSKRIVLTAAHCVKNGCSLEERVCENIENWKWTVITGDHDKSNAEKDKQKILVQSVYIHPKYPNPIDPKCKRGESFDLAILKLADDIRFDKASQPIPIFKSKSDPISRGPCLTPKITEFNNETRFIVNGWGLGSKDKNILNEASVPNYPDCVIDQSGICTGGPGKGAEGTCRGDSGGPLTWLDESDGQLKLVGVVSSGSRALCPKNKTDEKITFYPRVSHPDALDWINKIMNDTAGTDPNAEQKPTP